MSELALEAPADIAATYEALRFQFARRAREGSHRDALAWFAGEVRELQDRCPHPEAIPSCCGGERICMKCKKRLP